MTLHRCLLVMCIIILICAIALVPHLALPAQLTSLAALAAPLALSSNHLWPKRFQWLGSLIGALLLWIGFTAFTFFDDNRPLFSTIPTLAIGLIMAAAFTTLTAARARLKVGADVLLFVVLALLWLCVLALEQSTPWAAIGDIPAALALSALQLVAFRQLSRPLPDEAPIKSPLSLFYLANAVLLGLILAASPQLLAHASPLWALYSAPLSLLLATLVLRPTLLRATICIWGFFALAGIMPLIVSIPNPVLLLGFTALTLAIHAILEGFGDRLFHRPAHEGDLANKLQRQLRCGLVRVDLGKHDIHLSARAAEILGGAPRQTFASWLAHSSPAEALGLVEHMKIGEIDSFAPLAVTLKTPQGHLSLFKALLVAREANSVDLLLCSQLEAEEASRQSLALRDQLAQLHLREERLLSLASHELRTPAAALSMLIEDLDAGEPWEEVRDQMQRALEELLCVLEDLRATGSTSGKRLRLTHFRPQTIAEWLAADYSTAAQGAGLTFSLRLPEQASMIFHGDVGRMMMALEKLLRFTLQGRGPGNLGLTLLMSHPPQTQGQRPYDLTWEIRATYDGAPPYLGQDLFEPFAQSPPSGSARGSDARGPGLFTALKAAEALGGSLIFEQTDQSVTFILSHPATPADDQQADLS